MSELMPLFFNKLAENYQLFLSSFPNWVQISINLSLLTFVIFIYSIFIWKLYRAMATKNILKINLNKYNSSKKEFSYTFFTSLFYFIENVIIFPFFILTWYAVFTIFLILLTNNVVIEKILIISAIILSAIRITAYYNEDLSKDLAKLLPLTLLGVYLIQSFNFNFQVIISNFAQIPSLFQNILIYFLFLLSLEILLRLMDLIFFGLTDKFKKEIDDD